MSNRRYYYVGISVCIAVVILAAILAPSTTAPNDIIVLYTGQIHGSSLNKYVYAGDGSWANGGTIYVYPSNSAGPTPCYLFVGERIMVCSKFYEVTELTRNYIELRRVRD